MSVSGPQPERLFPEDNLPEVRPPSAGFIVQLFVIPAVVVLVLVLVWLLVERLAGGSGDPASYIREMKLGKANSWQEAANLADSLRSSKDARSDPALARELADFLDELLATPLPKPPDHDDQRKTDPRSQEIERRGFLCRALGEFEVADDALPVLLKAAGKQRSLDEVTVRRAALEGIAVLADNVRATRPLSDPRLIPTLIAASKDDETVIAEAGAFALGVVGGDRAVARLEKMLREAHVAEVHYNAATGLARNGNPACIAVLQEMIDPDSTRGVTGEETGEQRVKRALIEHNGLSAARLLASKNSQADLRPLVVTIEKLRSSDAPANIKAEAASTLRELSARRP